MAATLTHLLDQNDKKFSLLYNSHVSINLPSPPIPPGIRAFLHIYIIIIISLFIWTTVDIVRFPFGMDYGEAPLMDQARRIINAEVLYKSDLNAPPYVISNYPPLYPSVVACINLIFKTPIFQTGRLVSLFFTLLSGGIVGLFGYSLTQNKIIGALAAVIFLGNPYVTIWSSLARVDMMALAASLVGLYILYKRVGSIPWIVTAGVCFLISAFTRQTYLLSAPIAAFFWLFHHNKRRALLFALILGASTLLISGMINALTDGGFYLNIVLANINQYEISRTIMMFRQLLILWPVILLASVAALALVIWDRLTTRHNSASVSVEDEFPLHGLSYYSLGALIIAITIGKVGSDVNYFLELLATCSIWVALAAKNSLGLPTGKRLAVVSLFFFQLVWIIVSAIPLTRSLVTSQWEKLPYYESLYQRIQQSVQNGIVLSDDYLDMVVLSGQSIYYQPFEYGQLYHAGMWNTEDFTSQINQQVFPLIVIGGNTIKKDCCWPQPVSDALEDYYQLETGQDVILLTPQK
jgi:hypothetical protein